MRRYFELFIESLKVDRSQTCVLEFRDDNIIKAVQLMLFFVPIVKFSTYACGTEIAWLFLLFIFGIK